MDKSLINNQYEPERMVKKRVFEKYKNSEARIHGTYQEE